MTYAKWNFSQSNIALVTNLSLKIAILTTFISIKLSIITVNEDMFVPTFTRSASRLASLIPRRTYAASTMLTAKAAFPAPRLFDYETVTSNLSVTDAIESVEAAFGALAQGKVDVPMPMHIGIEETETAGPGDCHIST